MEVRAGKTSWIWGFGCTSAAEKFGTRKGACTRKCSLEERILLRHSVLQVGAYVIFFPLSPLLCVIGPPAWPGISFSPASSAKPRFLKSSGAIKLL